MFWAEGGPLVPFSLFAKGAGVQDETGWGEGTGAVQRGVRSESLRRMRLIETF